MIWLTWRQSRAQTAMMAGALAMLAVVLGVTGPGLADDYAAGLDACRGGDCSAFLDQFFRDHRGSGLVATAAVLVLPALIGIFWGAPLIARELEAGTHRLVWNQSVTRTRWLAVKLGLLGLAAIVAAGLVTVAVDWWSDPIEKAAAAAENVSRLEPLLFPTRGIVPIGYAAFAFVLGVTVGMLVRRTLVAMAITLAVFAAVQAAVPAVVRPHLIAPVRANVEITPENVSGLLFDEEHRVNVYVDDAVQGAWTLSSQTVDAAGRAIEFIPAQPTLNPDSGPCGLPPASGDPRAEMAPCLAEIERLGYRQRVSYQPGDRFWRLQWYETGIFMALALALAGFSFWWLRHRIA